MWPRVPLVVSGARGYRDRAAGRGTRPQLGGGPLSRTVGIEEELFLVDPRTRTPAPRSQQVLKLVAEHGVGTVGDELEHELFRHQVETKTPPVGSVAELREHVLAGRRFAADAAAAAGLATVASGTAPLVAAPAQVTTDERYAAMVETFGEIARHGDTCGMHVHVQVESPEIGVHVIDQATPWLPLVLALSANSPFHAGHDTGYASWRSQSWAQWPSAGPNERFGSLATYQDVARRLEQSGAAKDEGMLYFDARLSATFPTVEFRVADVCTDADDGVLIAALLRALVTQCVAEVQGDAGRADVLGATPVWRTDLLRAAKWRAARYGVSDRLLDPVTGELERVSVLLDRFVAILREPLEEAGDLDLVGEGMARVLAGGGASRQRAALERTASMEAVVDDLVERTGH